MSVGLRLYSPAARASRMVVLNSSSEVVLPVMSSKSMSTCAVHKARMRPASYMKCEAVSRSTPTCTAHQGVRAWGIVHEM
eukprot:scaffold199953_cov18-Tisochrysis_lutea.AAC.1